MENDSGDRAGTEGLVGQTAGLRAAVPRGSGIGSGGTGAIFIRAGWDGAILQEFREHTDLLRSAQRIVFL